LVFGGTGDVGQNLVKELIKSDVWEEIHMVGRRFLPD